MNTKEQAMDALKSLGYYVDNLWHIDDVKNNADNVEMDDDDAYEVLDRVMQSEWWVSKTFEIMYDEIDEIKNEIKR